VEQMRNDLSKIDSKMPTYPLWMRLTIFLGSLCESISDLQEAVRGDGNGSRGLLQRMTVIEGAIKVTQSDIREVLTMMRSVYGIDEESMKSKFDGNNHPHRRKSDTDMANLVLRYIVNRILPQVIVWALLGFVAFQFAVNQKIILLGQP